MLTLSKTKYCEKRPNFEKKVDLQRTKFSEYSQNDNDESHQCRVALLCRSRSCAGVHWVFGFAIASASALCPFYIYVVREQ